MGYVLFLNFIKNTINLIIYNLIFKYIEYIQLLPIKQDIVDSTFPQYILTPIKQDVKDLTFPRYISMYGLSNVPEVFKKKYFPKKEVENLLELKDIINNL